MEVSGAVSRRLPGLIRREIAQSSMEVSGHDARRAPCSLSISGGSVRTETRDFGLYVRRNINSPRFSDDGHVRYYVGTRCHGGRLKKEKEAVKKKLKLLKGLSGDSSAAFAFGFVFRFDDSSVGEFQADRFSIEETREVLERQLQQLKAEEKEQKRKRKLEKAKLKAARLQTAHDSSSSSSESSAIEGNMTNTRYRTRKANSPSLSQPFSDQWQANAIQGSALAPPLQTHQLNSNTGNFGVARSASVGRVEVCMGNKCKKAGAAALMEEFERVMGADSVVCGCKCMGRCRDGPNVRVSSSLDMETRSPNPLCIGVGVEDVGRIVAEHLGGQGEHKQPRFAPSI
ncbi:diacylglycerol O-acyltransferase 3, cytosolic-like [Cucurbita pepo subsp. pepo]|uniref:diacylglycerol O-acyltransferase 3, cytosolic-like n=1 Tax=Cucurbita pepo subsp. pepo TaxID=3664 RepID=UPI000C9D4D8E|nr:diacylglycerol O-acyltransferase 3, cytosolic-like [Cucurbita pepo subsp. pepo]